MELPRLNLKPETLNLKHDALNPEPETLAPKLEIPRWLIAAVLVVLAIGAVLILGRGYFAESAAFDAMTSCDAKISPYLRERAEDGNFVWTKPNGTDDNFGSIRINAHRDEIAAIVSLCESDPPLALRLFEKALKSDSKSAKIVALYCANYLARSQTTPQPVRDEKGRIVTGVLDASHFELMKGLLEKGNDLDVRKAALRAVSDLVIITNSKAIDEAKNPKAESTFAKISTEMEAAAITDVEPPDPKEDKDTKDKTRDLKIVTRKETLNGHEVLLVRWSTPALALAWWKEYAKDGHWDKDEQRFVVP